MKKLFLSFLFLTCICHAQSDRAYYYEIKPVAQQVKGSGSSYIKRYIHNDLQVEEGHMENTNPGYKISTGGKVLKDWFCEKEAGAGETNITIYYSPTSKDYYILLCSWAEDIDWIDAFYVTSQKIEYKGKYDYDYSNPTYYFNKNNPSYEFVENRNFEQVYTENGKLCIAGFVGGDVMRVVSYKHALSDTDYVALKYPIDFNALEKQPKSHDRILNLNLRHFDDIPEKYGIDWKNKKITYLDAAAREAYESFSKDPEPLIRFIQDTLIIADYNFERRNDPTTAFFYKDYYYFVASPYDDNPLLCKHIAKMEVDVYEKYGPYSYTYYPSQDTRLSELAIYIEKNDENYWYGKYRLLKLSEIENNLKNNNDYYTWRELPPWPYEIYKLMQRDPITVKNVTIYNDVAYYLEQLLHNKLVQDMRMNGTYHFDYARSSAQYILEKILEKFPNRTVAHLNLADVFWDKYDKEPAKKYYRSYIELMKKDGKEAKIPARAYERIK
jgi:hypothetical protein